MCSLGAISVAAKLCVYEGMMQCTVGLHCWVLRLCHVNIGIQVCDSSLSQRTISALHFGFRCELCSPGAPASLQTGIRRMNQHRKTHNATKLSTLDNQETCQATQTGKKRTYVEVGKEPAKKAAVAAAEETAASSSPPSPSAAAGNSSSSRPKRKSTAADPSANKASEESEDSDDFSDPEEDISQEEMERMLDFSAAREAGRDRVAPRTRYQYDLFIGLMADFFKSKVEFADLVIVKDELHFESVICPLPVHAVKMYLEHVEEKQVQVRASDSESLQAQQRTKHVSVGYFSTVIQALYDLYKCELVRMPDDMALLIAGRRRAYSRKIAQLKASGFKIRVWVLTIGVFILGVWGLNVECLGL